VPRFLLLPILLLALVAVPAAGSAAAAAGKPAATKKRCPSGTAPIVRQRGKRAAPKRDRRGRLRCRAVKLGRPPAPGATPIGQAANVADALRDMGAVTPRATARLERVLGRRRARRMLDVTIDGWQKAASAARAAQDVKTRTFTPSGGVRGTLTTRTEVTSAGADSGYTATASVTVEASRASVAELVPGLKDKLPSDLKAVKGEVDVKFDDKVLACPSEKGERTGSVKANGNVKITVERDGKPPLVMEREVDLDVTYTSRSGANAGDGTIDLDVRTTFRSSGTGVPTETYRGRRLGSGFGRGAILDADGKAAIREAATRDVGHFDGAAGGVFGPHGGWNYARGIGYSDLRSVRNVEAMVATMIHTDVLTLAALEYIRKVALPRAEKEACGYTVRLDVNGRGVYATHDASGQMSVTVTTAQVGDGAWHGEAQAAWTGLAFTSKNECAYVSPVSSGTFLVDLALTDAGKLDVRWNVDRSIAPRAWTARPAGTSIRRRSRGRLGPACPGPARSASSCRRKGAPKRSRAVHSSTAKASSTTGSSPSRGSADFPPEGPRPRHLVRLTAQWARWSSSRAAPESGPPARPRTASRAAGRPSPRPRSCSEAGASPAPCTRSAPCGRSTSCRSTAPSTSSTSTSAPAPVRSSPPSRPTA
jgi:hypothetical protein